MTMDPGKPPRSVVIDAADLVQVAEHLTAALALLRGNVAEHRFGASGVTLAAESVAESSVTEAQTYLRSYARYSGQAHEEGGS